MGISIEGINTCLCGKLGASHLAEYEDIYRSTRNSHSICHLFEKRISTGGLGTHLSRKSDICHLAEFRDIDRRARRSLSICHLAGYKDIDRRAKCSYVSLTSSYIML